MDMHGRVPFEFLDGGVTWDDAELGDIWILRWWRYTEIFLFDSDDVWEEVDFGAEGETFLFLH